MRWIHRALCLSLAGLFLYAAPRVGGYDGNELASLDSDQVVLRDKIRGLEGEIDVLRARARALRGGQTRQAQRIRDEEIAKIAREELHMLGQGERIVELSALRQGGALAPPKGRERSQP